MFIDEKKEVFKAAVVLSVFCVMGHCVAVEAASPKRSVKEGNLLYQKGDYAASREKYAEALKKIPESDIINFNLGTALYKDEDYEKAADHLQKALLSENDELKKGAYYNLGNALYKSGIMHEEDDISLAISSLEKSLSQYERALAIDKDDDAQHNYEYVKEELKRLKVKQQQQKQQKQQQQQDQGQSDQSDKSEGQESESDQQQQRQQQEDQQQQQDEAQQGQPEQDEPSQEQQEKSDQDRGQSTKEDYNGQQESGARSQDAQELTQEEARMLLESYQQAEEPQGLLNVFPESKGMRPVLKDW